MYYIYRHIRKDKNEVFYIGIAKINTTYNTYKSHYQRAYTAKSRNQHWHDIVDKTEYSVEILLHFETEEEAWEKEIELIKLYKPTLCNITDGGSGTNSYKHTKETKKRISEHFKGRTFSEETLKKINAAKCKPIRMFNDTESHIFASIKEASEYLGKGENNSNIGRYLKYGKSKVCGYKFEEIIEIKDKEP